MIGSDWGDCDPSNPKNRRLRPSVLVEQGGVGVLIDSSPDLREQLLSADVRRLDAVLWTHVHADHTHGIDDLRAICRLKGGPLDAYGLAEHLEALTERFSYCFAPLKPGDPVYRPLLTPRAVDGPFDVGGVRVIPFVQDHGYSLSLGYRIGAFAYSTDVVRLDEAAFAALEGVEAWVVDCMREEPENAVHATLPVTLSWIERVKPARAWLTHMSHHMDYETVRAKLPPGVEPAWDGLVIELPDA